ncbi:beta-galactosidase [Micrococcales bacterium 31B]|nr:beta-galactosidase [Micrococcales bacterium 31B]
MVTETSPALNANATTPRPEHPRPQFHRPEWLNLNGDWDFAIDPSDTGLERGLLTKAYKHKITVPFAPESELSGIGNTSFLESVWYRRTLDLPEGWQGRDDLRFILHFGAVDHDATVWVNGAEVVRHRGGFSSFSADITDALAARRQRRAGQAGGGDHSLVVRARDHKNTIQARGKQATWELNTHCQYTRTTGIWQTVWLEAVPRAAHVRRVTMLPNLAQGAIHLTAAISQNVPGSTLSARVSWEGEVVAEGTTRADLDLAPSLHLAIPAEHVHPWGVGQGNLYDVELSLTAGEQTDTVHAYTALRSVAIDGQRVLLNGRPTFQRLVLDQGYYADGLMTAPSDADLVRDIELSLRAGFNGARLHQKVFEERFLYHADRLGYLVWGEYGDWGVSGQGIPGYNQAPQVNFVAEWVQILQRDINHPSIIGWCPLNETHQNLHDRITVLDDATVALYEATKLADPTRPVIDASGYSHRLRHLDVYDSHSYEQDPKKFAKQQAGLAQGKPFVNRVAGDAEVSLPYEGQPFWVSEYGGIWWNAELAAQQNAANGQSLESSWGYGDRVRDLEAFYRRFKGLTDVLLDNEHMFGYCYTQLTDVFQEQNGVYGFDRSEKFDVERLRAVQVREAAIERTRPVA